MLSTVPSNPPIAFIISPTLLGIYRVLSCLFSDWNLKSYSTVFLLPGCNIFFISLWMLIIILWHFLLFLALSLIPQNFLTSDFLSGPWLSWWRFSFNISPSFASSLDFGMQPSWSNWPGVLRTRESVVDGQLFSAVLCIFSGPRFSIEQLWTLHFQRMGYQPNGAFWELGKERAQGGPDRTVTQAFTEPAYFYCVPAHLRSAWSPLLISFLF